jgi:hypothetical protein
MNSCRGIHALVCAMDRYKANSQLQAAACQILGNMALCDTGNDSIMQHGGIQSVVSALGVHASNIAVVKECVCALQSLATKNPKSAGAIGKQGGVQALVSVMELHKETVVVLNSGCRLLRTLMLHSGNRELPVRLDQRGLAMVVMMMNKHREDCNMQKTGMGVLWNTCSLKLTIGKMRGLEAVLGAQGKLCSAARRLWVSVRPG